MNIKEKILKIGKRKNCFIAFLIAILIAFTILGGLNGSNSGNIKANALEEPTSKNLDLNGIRYTYQTSLSELKNDYHLFQYQNNEVLFNISMNQENAVTFNLIGLEENMGVTSTEMNVYLEKTKDAITFYDLNYNIVENNDYTIAPIEPYNTNNVIFDYPENYNLNNYTKIEINFEALLTNLPNINSEYFGLNGGDYGNLGFFIGMAYLSNNVDTSDDYDYLYNNSHFYGYQFNKITNNITLTIPKFEGYNLKQIFCIFPTEENNDVNRITSFQPLEFHNNNNSFGFSSMNINYIDRFINNQNMGYGIGFNYDFKIGTTPYYKGNLLLSEEKYDTKLFDAMRNTPFQYGIITNSEGFVFGLNSQEYTATNSLTFKRMEVFHYGVIIGCFRNDNSTNYQKDAYFYLLPNHNNIIYNNQSQLLLCRGQSDLRVKFNDITYNGLSEQIDDVLYNVNYIGNVEEIEFNEKVQEDFENLLKTVGLGAFIGLLIGLFFGNPLLGAAIGAMWGLIVGIFPLLIDALQAIFGKDFLSGLYNFFKSITEFFANFVDTIINFLISIITNPFVLVLILIIAIIFVVRYFQKK